MSASSSSDSQQTTPDWVHEHVARRELRAPPAPRRHSRFSTTALGPSIPLEDLPNSSRVSRAIASLGELFSPSALVRRFTFGDPSPNPLLIPSSSIVFVPRETPSKTPSAVTPAEAKTAARSALVKAKTDAFDGTPTDDAQDVCSICCESIDVTVTGQRVAVTGCGHAYHIDCWKSWAERDNKTCPNCRAPLAIEECIAVPSPVVTPPGAARKLSTQVLELVDAATGGDLDEDVLIKDLASVPEAVQAPSAHELAVPAAPAAPAAQAQAAAGVIEAEANAEAEATAAAGSRGAEGARVAPTEGGQGVEMGVKNAPPSNANAGLHALPYKALQQRAKQAGVRANGKREELLARLLALAHPA